MKEPLLLIGGREPSWGFTWVELPWETLDEGTKVDHPRYSETRGIRTLDTDRETYGNCMPEYESAESFRICTNHVCIMFEMKCLLPTKVSMIRGSSFCKLLEAASTFEACP